MLLLGRLRRHRYQQLLLQHLLLLLELLIQLVGILVQMDNPRGVDR